MLGWIERKVATRYVKSGLRYLLMILVGALAGSDLPGIGELTDLLKENSDTLADTLATVIVALVLTWSARKNKKNSGISEETR